MSESNPDWIPRYDPKRADAYIASEIRAAVLDVIDSGQFIRGPEVEEFVGDLDRFLPGMCKVPCASGTDALTLLYRVANERHAPSENPKGAVLVPAVTFCATASAVCQAGLTPIFVDQHPDDPLLVNVNGLTAAAEEAIDRGHDVVAATVVHLYGDVATVPPEVKEDLSELGVWVIEDACQAFGGWGIQDGEKVVPGSQGLGGSFSFFPSKPLGAYGDGGLAVSQIEGVAEWMARVAQHGQEKRYVSSIPGMNSRLDAMQAAILRVKLGSVEKAMVERQCIAHRYCSLLDPIRHRVVLPSIHDGHAVHCFTIMVDEAMRDALVAHLRESGIDAAPVYPVALHEQPAFEDAPRIGTMEHAARASRSVVALPCWDGLTEPECIRVADAMLRFYATR